MRFREDRLQAPGFRLQARIACAVIACAIFVVLPVREEMAIDRVDLPADGRATATARVIARSAIGVETVDLWRHAIAWSLDDAAKLGIKAMRAHDGAIVFRAGTTPGALELKLGDASATLTLAATFTDADEDGLPDAAELLSREDRAAFTRWFTAIAEAQATSIDDAWPPIHHDCAGLVRFAYKEALRVHDKRWLDKRRGLAIFAAPDVAAFHYPDLPIIGDLAFRAHTGRFDPAQPIADQFTAAATAPALYDANTTFISRDIDEARAGDLLFFSVPGGTGSRMHTMIVLGKRPAASPDDRGERVVYHTGLEGEQGEVRLVSIAQLLEHPDASWHPLAHNPRFLGVHRLALVTHESMILGALQ